MSELAAAGPNADQIEFWNGKAGEKWVQYQDEQDATLHPVGERALVAAAIAPGERVIDVGCGCGATTLAIAERIGPRGSALGVDVSAVMLARASETAGSAANICFANADAASHSFADDPFDLVYSRFGVMFFKNPTAAFANLATALRPGGRLAFVCWRSLSDNPFFGTPLAAAGRYIELPPRKSPDEPGIFAFADDAKVRRILSETGFAEIELDRFDAALPIAGDANIDTKARFLLRIGPMAEALAEASETVRQAVFDELREHLSQTGGTLDSSTWIVTARHD